ncbi:MAG: metallophosphoesterase family protein [Leptospiraceae bacterium]|nr:metallophosphoesterase family protein [Leptospiraceae bacterium]
MNSQSHRIVLKRLIHDPCRDDRPNMRIAVLSDLHIGGDSFAQQADGFPALLDHLERYFDRIILLGDIFETAFPCWPWQSGQLYLRLFREHRVLSQRFRKDPYVLLCGNHDVVAMRRFGIPQRLSMQVDGLRLLFTHGHECERQYRVAWLHRLTDFYLWWAGFCKRQGFDGLYRLAYFFDYRQNVADGGLRFRHAARQLIRHQAYDCVVMGHTHREEMQRFLDGGIYINTGDCQSRCIAAAIDTGKRLFQLVELRQGTAPDAVTWKIKATATLPNPGQAGFGA